MRKVPKLRFKEFNDEWEEKKLKELILLQRGSSPRPIIKYLTTSEEGDNWIKIGDTNKESKYIISTKEKITKDGAKKSRKVENGEIILSNSMSFGRPFILKIDGYIHDGWFVIRKYEKNFNKEFLYQLLGSTFIQNQYKKLAAGGVVENISSELVYSVILGKACLKEQEKIATFLSSVDKKISLTEEKLSLFKEYKKGIMQKIFSQELRFKDSNGNNYPNWEKKKIENIFLAKSSSISQNTLENNNGNYTVYGATGKIKNINFYENENEYIGIIKDGAGVGRTFLCEKKSSVLGTLNYLETINNKTYLKFGYYLLKQIDFSKYIVGSSIPHIYFKDYKNEKINLPCLEEQKKIADFLSSIDNKIEKIENEVENLKEFKKGLLQQMFI